jgi:hypothetical protein
MSEPSVAASPLAHSRRARFWLRELPYIAVLTLTILGVAYTSASRKPLIGYWEFLAVHRGADAHNIGRGLYQRVAQASHRLLGVSCRGAIGLVCVTTGWLHLHDPKARFRMVWTQLLHWLAFLVAMNIVLLPSVQRMLNAPATGLALLMLLALGTFVAGVHVSWQICVLGIIMALCVPAIAWLAESALLLLLGVVVVIGIGITFRWRLSGWQTSKPPRTGELLD